jgi:RNA polymerase-binding transcription factor
MDKKQTQQFKKRVETRQQELRRSLTRAQEDGRTLEDGRAADQSDRAASSYTKDFLFRQSTNERNLLRAAEKALGRIRDGSFGQCVSCGNEINRKRLEAVPWTLHCIECQEATERKG